MRSSHCCDGFGRERSGHAAVPSLFADAKRADFGLQPLAEILPRARAAEAAVPPDGREAARQNLRRAQSHVRNQPADFRLAFVDEIGAGFGMLAVEKWLAHCEDAAADAIARVDRR